MNGHLSTHQRHAILSRAPPTHSQNIDDDFCRATQAPQQDLWAKMSLCSTQQQHLSKEISTPEDSQLTTARKSFLLFIKILFKLIGRDELMLEECKLMIYGCRLKNASSLPTDLRGNLLISVQTKLKKTVGESLWAQTMSYYTHYRNQKMRVRKLMASPIHGIFFPAEMSEFLIDAMQVDMLSHPPLEDKNASTCAAYPSDWD
jgi:hypothetical protein